ncbi:hypothetical protein F4819DRAFT_498750 [Hypoxylon fuscum]|nr:hypothetical protein F4819DRAFT_498750 [Hypoxylon fuscum]
MSLLANQSPLKSMSHTIIFRPYQQQANTVTGTHPDPSSIVAWYLNRDPKDWFRPPAGFDDEIRDRFSNAITEARNGRLDTWATTPEGSLALIILLDQFPRNIYRQRPESYSSDEHALRVATNAVAREFDTYASRLHQMLFYMPFMHAEDLLAQVTCRLLLKRLVSECSKDYEHLEFLRMGAGAAESHLACIQALGRFPKRNDYLGRYTTDEELQWLHKYPDGF